MRRLAQAEDFVEAWIGIIVPKWKEAALIWHVCKGDGALMAILPFSTSAFSSFPKCLYYLFLHRNKISYLSHFAATLA